MSAAHLHLVEHPAASRHRLRQRLSGLIDRLICALDALDGDPDLEDGADDEPSLSFTGYMNQDVAIRTEPTGGLEWLDLEEASEDEGGEHDGREPSLVGVHFFSAVDEACEANTPETGEGLQ